MTAKSVKRVSTKEPITECTKGPGLRSNCPDAGNCWVAHCGYSRLLKPNPYWKEQKGICRYEHCIENRPVSSPRTSRSCPLFGHDCPDGSRSAKACLVQMDQLEKRLEGRMAKSCPSC